jgi:large subunit ribosomal protein L12
MEYVYSAMLLHSAGQKIDEQGVEKVLKAAGVKPDTAKIKALVAALEGVNIKEVIEKSVLVAAAPAAVAAPAVESEEEEKKEEGKEEKKEEEAAAGLGALFG